MNRLIVTGTDTGIGKTVFAAGLAGALNGFYWKPIQAGIDPEGDSETAVRLSGLSADRILPEAYRLALPASPHLSAREEGVEIEIERLSPPSCSCESRSPAAPCGETGPRPSPRHTLVIEGAGGVLVPVAETLLMADLFRHWQAPAILCARTGLGTINHSLMSVEALRARGVPVLGIVFIGDAHDENERIVPKLAGVPHLGRLPMLNPLDATSLAKAMQAIDLATIRTAL